MQFEGLDFTGGTYNSEYLRASDFKPIRAKKLPDQIITTGEKMDGESEAKTSFKVVKINEKTSLLRPKTSLENSGEFGTILTSCFI